MKASGSFQISKNKRVIRDKPLDSSGFKTLVNLAVETAVETAKTNLLLTATSYPVSSLLPCFLACPLTEWKDLSPAKAPARPQRNIFISGQSEGGLFCRVHW